MGPRFSEQTWLAFFFFLLVSFLPRCDRSPASTARPWCARLDVVRFWSRSVHESARLDLYGRVLVTVYFEFLFRFFRVFRVFLPGVLHQFS